MDVDTFRGTAEGVPRLIRLLARHRVTATIFFSVGPDNMGRHLLRLVRPSFLRKMLRTRAPSLYGWDILLAGTLLPGRRIGAKLGDVIRAARDAGHEIGFHAWDHHAWQVGVGAMSEEEQVGVIARGVETMEQILGEVPTCSAVPGWRANEATLRAKARFPFRYSSDCRGTSVFLPRIGARTFEQPQVPVDLPTYDELIGMPGVSDASYNACLLEKLSTDRLNILTVHAEVEGISRHELFADFLERLRSEGIATRTLGSYVEGASSIDVAPIERDTVPGREGWIARQGVPVDAPGGVAS